MILLSVLALAVGVLTPVAAGAAETSDLTVPDDVVSQIKEAKTGVFIVQMADAPAVAMDGEDKVKKVNPNSAAVKNYRSNLTESHDSALKSVGGEKIYSYTVSFNGFAAVLTGTQAAELMARDDVVYVWQDEIRQLTTDNSPEFLGLTDAEGGLWGEHGLMGEDVIVGVIDTGIWPEHPSFSDQLDLSDEPGNSGKRTLAYGPPTGWYGTCQSGELFSQNDCNNKLIGAQYFKDGFTNNGIKISGDYLSARDADGHGSHTASTAAGNAGVEASLLGVERGEISGIAPRARVAMYKACWADDGCAVSDLTMAIDTAVADGVDVINYSIGSDTPSFGPDDAAFLWAEAAGVHVATSNGNAGPGAGTVGSPAWTPWVTAVGASTQDRTFQGSVTLGDSSKYSGASVTAGTDPLPLIDSATAGSELCIPGELDSSVVAGNVVLCLRGAIARVDKSKAVMMAGGAGMILFNANDGQSQVTDNHFVPSVHINNTDGLVIKAYIASEGASATASITGGVYTTIDAPWMAGFSSRGPNGGSADIIKPDVTAPGVNILAAASPTPFLGAPDQLFQAISGTSMSSPHVAGLFALLKESHPNWSPSAAKSALMTTAYELGVMKEDGTTPADPFDVGAGHVSPNTADSPGLVYEAGLLDYAGFMCGSGLDWYWEAGTCEYLKSIGIPFDASDLNYPSIGIGALAGSQTVMRTVTAVAGGTYNVTIDAPDGIDVVVTPASFTLDSGTSETFTASFTATGEAVLDAWAFGSMTWSDGSHVVRSPIAVKPVLFASPDNMSGIGIEGSLDFEVGFGYTGVYSAGTHGLVPAVRTLGNVVDDPANDINVALGTGVGITVHDIEVPAGTTYARFSLFDDYTDGADDLDLYVFGPTGFVGGSGSGTSAEAVNVVLPVAGTYSVIVHGWQTDGPDSNYTLFSWAPGADEGNLAITAPAAASLGTGTVTVDWAGLLEGEKYLGAVSHSDDSTTLAVTALTINTDG